MTNEPIIVLYCYSDVDNSRVEQIWDNTPFSIKTEKRYIQCNGLPYYDTINPIKLYPFGIRNIDCFNFDQSHEITSFNLLKFEAIVKQPIKYTIDDIKSFLDDHSINYVHTDTIFDIITPTTRIIIKTSMYYIKIVGSTWCYRYDNNVYNWYDFEKEFIKCVRDLPHIMYLNDLLSKLEYKYMLLTNLKHIVYSTNNLVKMIKFLDTSINKIEYVPGGELSLLYEELFYSIVDVMNF